MFEKIKLGFGLSIGMCLGYATMDMLSKKLTETVNRNKEKDSNKDETSE